MKKIINKILMVILIAVLSFSIVACGNNNNGNGGGGGISETGELTGELKIMILNRGYGMAWLDNMIKGFTAKNPKVKATYDEAITTDQVSNSIKKGSSKNDYDIYFDVSEGHTAAVVTTYSGVEGGLYDFSSLYETKIPGESVTLGQKMNATVRNELEFNGKHYTVPYATSTLGINYNETVLNEVLGEGNWSVPRTSNELLELASAFTTKSKEHFLLYGAELDLIGRVLFLGWWGQYEGIEEYNNFCSGSFYDFEEDQLISNDKRIYNQIGRLRALQAIQSLVNYSTNNVDSLAVSNLTAETYKDYQSKFYSSSYGYALYPCGDWLEQESSDRTDCVVKMMKLPVISTITEKLENKNMSEETLQEVVSAIDEGRTSFEGVSSKDFAKIKEARNTAPSMCNFHIGFTPAYSNAIPLAEQFLLYMASDEGLAIFKKHTLGGFLPYDFDYSKIDGYTLTDYEQSVYEINKDANFVYFTKMAPIFYKGNALFYTMSSGAASYRLDEALFNYGKENSHTGMSAEEIYNYFINYYSEDNGSRWSLVLKKI